MEIITLILLSLALAWTVGMFAKAAFMAFPKTLKAAGEPNLIGAFIFAVPCDSAFETTPTTVEVGLLACPDDLGVQLELNYVGFRANTIPVDSAGTGTILGDLEFIDDSDSDSVTNLKAAYDFEAATALVNNTVWSGAQVLDPGDAINMEIASDGTHNTAAEGAALIVMGRILAKNAL